MSSNHWSNSDDPRKFQRGLFGASSAWIIGFVILFALIAIAFFGFRVLFADEKGRGEARIQKESAGNRIAQQERFEELFQDIKATDLKLTPLAAAAKTGGQTEQTTYTGTVTYCLSKVGEYNALSRKYTAEAFRAADLPYEIDKNDPTTDCKENA